MQSPLCELAIKKALSHGNALLKFVSPNDVGLTGGHQCGFYLPKSVFPTFTPQPPERDVNTKYDIRIVWQENYETDSVITWYGKKTRSEYRLTRFGRGFPYLTHDTVGDLLVLTRIGDAEFVAFILDLDDDIEEIQATLGLQVSDEPVMYQAGILEAETEDACINRYFRKYVETLNDFPPGSVFSLETRNALKRCLPHFERLQWDDTLMRSMEAEYQLFKMAERQLCQSEIIRVFKNVDDFLTTASSILNRRKVRAGRSLENHVEHMLKEAEIPHQMRPHKIDGKPDIVIPNEAAYFDNAYPVEKLFVVGIKTTCKDRWRQVLNEGKRVPIKHILTTQPGISTNQLNEMSEANVRLIVPQKLHRDYPRERSLDLLNVSRFIQEIRDCLR